MMPQDVQIAYGPPTITPFNLTGETYTNIFLILAIPITLIIGLVIILKKRKYKK